MQGDARRSRRWIERGVLGSLILGTTLILVAGVGSFFPFQAALLGGWASVVLILLAGAMLASRELHVFRTILRRRGSTRYEQLRRWTQLKIASILLFLLLLVAALTLLTALASRMGMIDPPGAYAAQMQFVWTLLTALTISLTFGVYLSLRVSLEHQGDQQRLYATIGLAAGASLALLGALVPGVITQTGFLRTGDGVFFLLAAALVLGATLYPLRGLPTPYRIFMHDPTQVRGPVHYTRGKGVFLPVLVAFGLLFLLLLLFSIFGLGLLQAVDQLAESIWLTLLLILLFAAMGASFIASLFLARKEDRPALYGKTRSLEARRELWISGTALVAAALFGAAAIMVANGVAILGLQGHRWIDLAVVAILVALGPIGFYKAYQMRRIRRMEDRFPDFLRDIASSHKGGLTLASSVHVAAKGDYGDLTPEIAKMSDQLSWNVAFEEVFDRFGKSVRTPVVQRTVSLILQASRSGGSTVDVLEAASRDAREIKNLENQRRMNMTLYLSVIYVTFFVFLGVVSVLYSRFMPEIIEAALSTQSSGATGLAALDTQAPSLDQYRSLYYLAAVVQAVGNGVIAGLMTAGRALHGLRHAFMMVLAAFAVFSLYLL